MKEFDHTGLLLAEYQAKLFEASGSLNCSSPIFLRRFLRSDLARQLDENSPEVWAFVIDEGLDSLKEQFGETDYGKEKYPPECLFWMGYMYRYICYTREERTRFVMQLSPHQLMNHVFPAYHTQDPEWVIASLLEDQNPRNAG